VIQMAPGLGGPCTPNIWQHTNTKEMHTKFVPSLSMSTEMVHKVFSPTSSLYLSLYFGLTSHHNDMHLTAISCIKKIQILSKLFYLFDIFSNIHKFWKRKR
jgi:hypothetical protein